MHRTTACSLIAMFAAAPAFAGPVIGVFSTLRQGQFELSSTGGASQFWSAIVAAYPAVEFHPFDAITPAALAGCDTVILSSASAGQQAIVPLSSAEQAALRGFVDGGGGAVIFTDNDSFAGGNSTPANHSLTDPFGLTSSGTGLPWQQQVSVPPSHPASPVLNGPFGTVSAYSVGWSGWYPGAGSAAGALVLGVVDQSAQPGLVVFPPRALGATSGCAVFFSDSTMAFTGYYAAANRVVTLNALDATLRRCGPADIGRQGGLAGPDGNLDNNDFIVFIDYFFTSNPAADRGTTGGVAGVDGQFDNNDFIVFIDQFFAGCGAG